MEEKPLQLIIRPNLTLRPAQETLYKLISQKLKDNQSITYEEAQDIYFKQGCRNMINGWPHYSYSVQDNETKQWIRKDVRLSEEFVKYTVFQWLTFNIGKLVIKGYLKIIPQIELN
jgi:hypothetical protein